MRLHFDGGRFAPFARIRHIGLYSAFVSCAALSACGDDKKTSADTSISETDTSTAEDAGTSTPEETDTSAAEETDTAPDGDTPHPPRPTP